MLRTETFQSETEPQSANSSVSDFWRQAFDPTVAPFGTYKPSHLWKQTTRLCQASDQTIVGRFGRKIQAAFLKSPRLLLDYDYNDLSLRLSPAFYSQERALLKTGKHPEEADLQFLSGIRGERIVFVDIGANTGFYSLHAARLADSGSRIIAIEPDPNNSIKLAFQISANGFDKRIDRIECAIGSEKGTMELYIRDSLDFGQNSLVPASDGNRAVTSARIPVETLLGLVNTHGLKHIDYLKIDVEGYEDQVLYPFFTGSPRVLWPKQILMEAKINEAWHRNILSDLTTFGYSVKHTSEDNVWMVLPNQ